MEYVYTDNGFISGSVMWIFDVPVASLILQTPLQVELNTLYILTIFTYTSIFKENK